MVKFKNFLTNLKKSGIEKDLQRLGGFDTNNYNELVDIVRSASNPLYQNEYKTRIKELGMDAKSEKQLYSVIKRSLELSK